MLRVFYLTTLVKDSRYAKSLLLDYLGLVKDSRYAKSLLLDYLGEGLKVC